MFKRHWADGREFELKRYWQLVIAMASGFVLALLCVLLMLMFMHANDAAKADVECFRLVHNV